MNHDCVIDPQMQPSGQCCRRGHRTRNELRLHNVDPRTCSLIGQIRMRRAGAGVGRGHQRCREGGWVHAVARITLQVIKRTELHTFQVVPRRWVVERTFGWLLRYRRLVRDYERRPEHQEAMVYWATVMIMTRRLARRSTDPPLQRRWGQPRTAVRTPVPAPARTLCHQALSFRFNRLPRRSKDRWGGIGVS
jgi:transposase